MEGDKVRNILKQITKPWRIIIFRSFRLFPGMAVCYHFIIWHLISNHYLTSKWKEKIY